MSIGTKYGNRKVDEDGYTFASLKERNRYRQLKLELLAGAIADLGVHPTWRLFVGDTLIGRYTADFAYTRDGVFVVEDVKSGPTKTTAYQLRKKLMKACHGIDITEV